MDRGLLEIFGPFGISNLLLVFAKKITLNQTGLPYHYIRIITLSIFLFLFIYIVFIFNIPFEIFFIFIFISFI